MYASRSAHRQARQLHQLEWSGHSSIGLIRRPSRILFNFPGGQRISMIYLVLAAAGATQAFIDCALKAHQVKRFILLDGDATKLGTMDKFGSTFLIYHSCILRPAWFIDTDY